MAVPSAVRGRAMVVRKQKSARTGGLFGTRAAQRVVVDGDTGPREPCRRCVGVGLGQASGGCREFSKAPLPESQRELGGG